MPLTATQYQAILAAEFDFDPINNPTLVAEIPTLWIMNDDRAFDLKLQYLYTKASIVRWLLQGNWRKFDWTRGDTSKDQSDIPKQLLQLLGVFRDDIKALEAGLMSDLSPGTSLVIKGTEKDPTNNGANPYYTTFIIPVFNEF